MTRRTKMYFKTGYGKTGLKVKLSGEPEDVEEAKRAMKKKCKKEGWEEK